MGEKECQSPEDSLSLIEGELGKWPLSKANLTIEQVRQLGLEGTARVLLQTDVFRKNLSAQMFLAPLRILFPQVPIKEINDLVSHLFSEVTEQERKVSSQK